MSAALVYLPAVCIVKFCKIFQFIASSVSYYVVRANVSPSFVALCRGSRWRTGEAELYLMAPVILEDIVKGKNGYN